MYTRVSIRYAALRDSPPDPAPPNVPPRNNYSTADSLRARLAGYMDAAGPGGQQHDNALDDDGEYLSDVMGHYATPGRIVQQQLYDTIGFVCFKHQDTKLMSDCIKTSIACCLLRKWPRHSEHVFSVWIRCLMTLKASMTLRSRKKNA